MSNIPRRSLYDLIKADGNFKITCRHRVLNLTKEGNVFSISVDSDEEIKIKIGKSVKIVSNIDFHPETVKDLFFILTSKKTWIRDKQTFICYTEQDRVERELYEREISEDDGNEDDNESEDYESRSSESGDIERNEESESGDIESDKLNTILDRAEYDLIMRYNLPCIEECVKND